MKSFNEYLNYLYYLLRRNSWMIDPRFYFKTFEKIEIKSPIFLLGNQGDGLTLVSRMLRRNKNVISPTGNHRYWTGADEFQNVFGPSLPAKLTGIRHKAPKDKILPPPRSWSYGADRLLGYYRNTEADVTESDRKIFKKRIKYVLQRYGKGIDSPRHVDKSQVYTVKVSYINEMLKKEKPIFILITRDPYAACYRAASGKAGDMRRYSSYISWKERLCICSQHWFNSMNAALVDANRVGNNLLVLKFEEILKNPEASMRKICEFVNLEYDAEMIPQKHHTIPFGSRYSTRWFPLRTSVNEPYYNKITKEEVEVIEKYCGTLANGFGYEKPIPKC